MVVGFRNYVDMTLDSVGNGYRLCILRYLNRWTRAGINGCFGVPGENDNGRRVVEFCAKIRLCVGNIF